MRAVMRTMQSRRSHTCRIVGVATDVSIVTLLFDIPCQSTDRQCHHPISQRAETRVNMPRHAVP